MSFDYLINPYTSVITPSEGSVCDLQLCDCGGGGDGGDDYETWLIRRCCPMPDGTMNTQTETINVNVSLVLAGMSISTDIFGGVGGVNPFNCWYFESQLDYDDDVSYFDVENNIGGLFTLGCQECYDWSEQEEGVECYTTFAYSAVPCCNPDSTPLIFDITYLGNQSYNFNQWPGWTVLYNNECYNITELLIDYGFGTIPLYLNDNQIFNSSYGEANCNECTSITQYACNTTYFRSCLGGSSLFEFLIIQNGGGLITDFNIGQTYLFNQDDQTAGGQMNGDCYIGFEYDPNATYIQVVLEVDSYPQTVECSDPECGSTQSVRFVKCCTETGNPFYDFNVPPNVFNQFEIGNAIAISTNPGGGIEGFTLSASTILPFNELLTPWFYEEGTYTVFEDCFEVPYAFTYPLCPAPLNYRIQARRCCDGGIEYNDLIPSTPLFYSIYSSEYYPDAQFWATVGFNENFGIPQIGDSFVYNEQCFKIENVFAVPDFIQIPFLTINEWYNGGDTEVENCQTCIDALGPCGIIDCKQDIIIFVQDIFYYQDNPTVAKYQRLNCQYC